MVSLPDMLSPLSQKQNPGYWGSRSSVAPPEPRRQVQSCRRGEASYDREAHSSALRMYLVVSLRTPQQRST